MLKLDPADSGSDVEEKVPNQRDLNRSAAKPIQTNNIHVAPEVSRHFQNCSSYGLQICF